METGMDDRPQPRRPAALEAAEEELLVDHHLEELLMALSDLADTAPPSRSESRR
jgi:hypothetical protein